MYVQAAKHISFLLLPLWQIWFWFLPLTVFSLHSFFRNKFYFCLHFHCLLHSIHSLYRFHSFDVFIKHFILIPAPFQIAFHLLPPSLITFHMQFPSQFSFHFQLSITDLFSPAALITQSISFWSFCCILYLLCLTLYFICFFDLNVHFIWNFNFIKKWKIIFYVIPIVVIWNYHLMKKVWCGPHRVSFCSPYQESCCREISTVTFITDVIKIQAPFTDFNSTTTPTTQKNITTTDLSTQHERCLGLCVIVCFGSTCLFWFCSRRLFGFALQYRVPTCDLLG